MPNHKSAEKRMRQNQKRRAINRSRRSALRTQIKKFRAAVEAENPTLEELKSVYRESQITLDRAVSQRVIHRNKAARLKSRMVAAISRKTGSSID